jgi:hypothetical protein
MSLGIDWLHSLSLGVFQTYLCMLVHELLVKNAWACQGAAAAVFELGVGRLREDLFTWYESERKAGRKHTEVQKLTPSMLGSFSKGAFGLHGSETNTFLSFANDFLVPKYRHVLGTDRYGWHMIAVESLRRILNSIRENPRKYSVAAQQRYCSDVQKHLWALEKLNIECKPKHHFFIEQAGRCS